MLPDPSTARDPVERAQLMNNRRMALLWCVQQTRALGRIPFDLTTHFDWDKCRVNVYHMVSPRLVKWTP